MRPALVLRPQPGNDRTAGRLRHLGLDARQLPLFAVRALPWTLPGRQDVDALLLTSAQAVRLGGAGLRHLAALPVVAVGERTAEAARRQGLDVRVVGSRDAVAAVSTARSAGFRRLLHLAGRERTGEMEGVASVPVYAAEAVEVPLEALRRAAEGETVGLLHSSRAARRFADLVARDAVDRARIRIAALSATVLEAAGTGWADARAVEQPDDDALCRLAAALAHD